MTPTGVYGGSFNPAHRGHRNLSRHAARLLRLEEVWWLVSPGNPLKPQQGMAPLPARVASARAAARRLPARVTAIERALGTRYTAETLRRLVRRYPKRRFIWLMGADNLAQLHLWRGWRDLARTVVIAVVARPGYDVHARPVRAMGWLRRYVRPAGQAGQWTRWKPPAIVLLPIPTDPTSATGLRTARPDWAAPHPNRNTPRLSSLRDPLTHRPIR